MNDDLSIAGDGSNRPRPELPLPGPPLIPSSVLPVGADRWRWYHALLAFVGGFVFSQMVVLLLAGIWASLAGVSVVDLDENSSFVIVASVINQSVFIAASYFVARMSGPVSFRDFGLVRAPFLGTVWRMALLMVGYFVLLAVYSDLVNLKPDTAPERLGASNSDLHMLAFALLVGALAPIAEEILFRGLLYRALRNGVGVWGGAIISGLLFGLLHIDAASGDRLLQVIPLAVLGISFALLYHWTGTLYAPIALHATNNAIAVVAYASRNESELGIALAVVVWLLMMAACVLGPRLTDRVPKYALPL